METEEVVFQNVPILDDSSSLYTIQRRAAVREVKKSTSVKEEDKDIDDLLTLTDTSSSSNPGIFETNQALVLELHDIIRDEPTTNSVTPSGKIKKKKKKRSQPETEIRSSSSSSGLSDSIPRLTDTVERDEFYDADESYHELTDANTANIAAVTLAQVHSENGQDQKNVSEQTQSQPASATPREPSTTITKPAVPP